MDKSTIIKSLTTSFANVLAKDKRINKDEAMRILNSAVNLIEQKETRYHSSIKIAQHACDQLKKLNDKI